MAPFLLFLLAARGNPRPLEVADVEQHPHLGDPTSSKTPIAGESFI